LEQLFEAKKMKKGYKPVALKNAPLEYAPANEQGVVFLFAHVARRCSSHVQMRPFVRYN
jgi:hypothetical protein